MTALNPEYATEVVDALNCGHDFEADRVFTYVSDDETIVSEDDEENDENADVNNDHVNMAVSNSIQRCFPPPPPERGMLQVTMNNLRNDETLIVLDTGATAHVAKTLSGFIANRRKLSSEIFGNHGDATPIIKRYDKADILHDKTNKPVSRLVLKGVNYAPASSFNLFAVSQSMKEGWKLYGNFNGFILTRVTSEIRFDIRIPSGSGYLWAARLMPEGKSRFPNDHETNNLAGETDDNDSNAENSDDEDDSFNDAPNNKRTADAKERNSLTKNNSARSKRKYMCNGISKEYAHVLMGHENIRSALASVKYLKFRICTDTARCRQVIACEGCARGKARKKVSAFAEQQHTSK